VNQQKTTAIVLRRVDYGEADRILTVLTADVGKLSLMAKGVRRVKSKLAGGIELFSTTEITYILGRGSISTLVSARLKKHYAQIVSDIDRTMLGYELIKLLDKITEDQPEPAYFELLDETFQALNDHELSIDLIKTWFTAQMLRLAGHTPNLQYDVLGAKLNASEHYTFDHDATACIAQSDGLYGVDEIKFLRLVFAKVTPRQLSTVVGHEKLISHVGPLVVTLRQLHLKV